MVTFEGSPPKALMFSSHPLQGGHPVKHAPIGRGVRQQEETLRAKAVVDADQDNAVPRQTLSRRTTGEALEPPVNPPPWTQKNTGRPAGPSTGVNTLRLRQSSPGTSGSRTRLTP